MERTEAIRLVGVTKTFGSIVANKDVNMTVYRGEILAILGENGSGKTTLMNMIAGIYYPDEGQIFIDGKEVVISSPNDAFAHGIGMIHQHFKLVDVFTATENIVLGYNDGEKYDIKRAKEKVKAISEKYGFVIDPDKKIYQMSVSEKQTVEIVKVLYRGADILILDEPTAVLTPQETEHLFSVLRKMRADGKSIIIITHKMHEVLSISDRVAVLRRGEYIASVETAKTNENELTELMVGEKISLNIGRSEPKDPSPRLEVRHINARDRDGVSILSDISFTARSGEILGIAGIAGSGQRELLESIAGLAAASGRRDHLSRSALGQGYRSARQNADADTRPRRAAFVRPRGQTRHGSCREHGHHRQHDAAQLPEGQIVLPQPHGAEHTCRRNNQKPQGRNSRRHNTRPPSIGRKCAEGAGRTRDRIVTHSAHGSLPRPRARYQLFLYDI